MKTTQKNYVEGIQQIIDTYLKVFPEEADKLALMLSLLHGADENVCNRKNLPGHLTSGAFVLNEKRRSVLLISHNFLQKWLQPGGHMELYEHPVDAAYREVCEEVGAINVTLHSWHKEHGIPLDLDSHAIPESVQKSEPPHYHHDFRYVFLCDDSVELKLQTAEVSGAKWVSLDELQSGKHEESLSRVANKIQKFVLKEKL